MTLDEAILRISLGKHEKTLREFMRRCKKAGYQRVAFGINDSQIESCKGWPFSYHGSVFADPKCNDPTFPLLWQICDAMKVAGGAGNSHQHALNVEFVIAVGALSFYLEAGEWHTDFRYSSAEYKVLVDCCNAAVHYYWPFDFDKYGISPLDFYDDESLKRYFKAQQDKYPKMTSAVYDMPLSEVPLLINHAYLKPVAMWRMKLGR